MEVRVATGSLLINPLVYSSFIPKPKPFHATFHATRDTETEFFQAEYTFLSVIFRLEALVMLIACFDTLFGRGDFVKSFTFSQIIPVFPVLRNVWQHVMLEDFGVQEGSLLNDMSSSRYCCYSLVYLHPDILYVAQIDEDVQLPAAKCGAL
jgi:hypothetical protein